MPRSSSRGATTPSSPAPQRRSRRAVTPSRPYSPSEAEANTPSGRKRAGAGGGVGGDTPSRRRRLSSMHSDIASAPASPMGRRGRRAQTPSAPASPARGRGRPRARSATPSASRNASRGGAERQKTPVPESPAKRPPPLPPVQYDPVDDDAEDVGDWASDFGGDGDGASTAAFEPAHFLRCHSSRGDPSDVQTELWDCKFMPRGAGSGSGGFGGGIGDVVATCGGNSVCLLHVSTGTLLKKFSHPDLAERLGALAWSRLRLDSGGARRMAILAVGGSRKVYLLHPDSLTWYASFSVAAGHAKSCREVTALQFHPRRSRWLLAATGDGGVSLWDVGVPAPPMYDVTPRQLLRIETETPPLALAIHASLELLLVGCEGGLCAWPLTLDVVRGERQPREVRYTLPAPSRRSTAARDGDGEPFVDAVTVLGTDDIAVKCAGRGCVYVWSAEALVPPGEGSGPVSVDLRPIPCRVLRWSDTDAAYLGLGAGSRMLAAGDDRGDIWLWDWRDGSAASGKPANTLHWPRPEDDELARARKVPLHKFPILVNRVCLSEDERHVVAVTHNNMVCIWRRAGEGDNDLAAMEVD